MTVAAIEGGVPTLVEARALLDRFHAMVRRKTSDLDGWITEAARSLPAPFAAGLSRDKGAVAAAIAEPWSDGRAGEPVGEIALSYAVHHATVSLLPWEPSYQPS